MNRIAAAVAVSAITTFVAGVADVRADAGGGNAQLGPRPFFLVDQLKDGELKETLAKCADGPFVRKDFSIGHRGAPMQFPEHTKESYEAAAVMGAGILECDVTFTKDRELVCRHSQCDLHTTTNILAIPDLAAKCSKPFTPADSAAGTEASAECCTSDITLAEFKTLKGKMDAADKSATTVEDYLGGTAEWRTDLYVNPGTLMTHAESIQLFDKLGAKFTPELKGASVDMPFDGDFTQAAYAQKLVDEYKAAGIDPARVFPQSFNIEDVRYWIANEPAFGVQAVYLDDRYEDKAFDHTKPETWSPDMETLAKEGVKIIAPPMWMLVAVDEKGGIVPSVYAKAAQDAGLDIITWTIERSGPLDGGGGWYYQTITDATDNDGVMLKLLHVLAQDVKVKGVFSDWPATTTYYANCMDLP